MRDRASASVCTAGGGLLGPALQKPAYLSFVARLVGRLSRPVSQHPPPAFLPSVFSSACLKAKARQKQSNGTAKAAGRGRGGAMMGVLPSWVNRYGPVIVI